MNNQINLGSRAGVIVIHNNCLLLIYRQKNGKIYYVFPGGTIEPNETKEVAAIRELFEETTIIAKNPKLFYQLHIKNIPANNKLGYKDEFLFLCEYVSGNPKLSEDAIETTRISQTNSYEPIWVDINTIKDLRIYPIELKELLLKDIENNFSQKNRIKIDVNHSDLKN